MIDDFEKDEGPQFVPQYSKPDAPGIAMNFDNTVSILHIVRDTDTFEDAVSNCFDLIKQSQTQYPDWPRSFFLEIEGHEDDKHGFDSDFVEFQQEFFFATLAHFVTAFELPLTGPLLNPNPQRNDLPDQLVISG
ncbi:MAG: hypothetical protein HKN43_12990 [Rhodothermales bacterium]|nr:hypothetical protein [Rhodothermales bacterium]